MVPEHMSAGMSGAAAFLRDGYWIADGPPDKRLIAQLLAAAESADDRPIAGRDTLVPDRPEDPGRSCN